MCGIGGYLGQNYNKIEQNISNTLQLMKRRGPDSKNFYNKNYLDKEILLLHSRLNIIDLNNRSNQPYIDEDLVLVFNGEIYNYLEIKNELIKKNYKFKTDSDTEVLIKSYREYGDKCVDYFNGMWAFAIWDLKKKILFLSRDPFGEKPLYYYINKDGFYFASEIKFIKSLTNDKFEKNNDKIFQNLFYGYKSLNKTNDTFFKDVNLLEVSSNLTIDLDIKLKSKKYWKPKLNINHNMKANEASDELQKIILESIKLRMRSDVPIAFCLSGGIDSGFLVSCAKKIFGKEISTFSIIDKDERYNEQHEIELISNDLGIKSNLFHLNNNKNIFFERLKKLTEYHDGPIATLSYYIHSFLSENISKSGYKVAISGTGADELFTGYYDHFLLQLEAIKNTTFFQKNLNDWKKYINPILRNKFLKDPFLYINDPSNRDLVFEKNFNILKYSKKKDKFNFKENNYCDELLRNRMLNEMFNEVVPVILKHDDLNSMYYSVENRSPYLDRNILNFSLTIPPQLLIRDGYQKKVLREASSNILNDKIKNNRKKKGFNASISSIIDLSDKDVNAYIFDKNSEIAEFVDLNYLKDELSKKEIPNHISKFLFSILSTKFFLESF